MLNIKQFVWLRMLMLNIKHLGYVCKCLIIYIVKLKLVSKYVVSNYLFMKYNNNIQN